MIPSCHRCLGLPIGLVPIGSTTITLSTILIHGDSFH
jgi:hypothetical protein